jgi:5-methylthioadenosine/S-adenosylhomocysteine deaminase
MKIDLLVRGGHLFSMQGDGVGYIPEGSLAIDGGRILAVAGWDDLSAAYQAEQTLDASHHAILPGFIDAHMHLHLALLRGLAQDTSNWMLYGLGPFSAHLTPEAGNAGARLALVEALKAGTTTFGDYGPHMDETCRFMQQAGVRARVTGFIREVPSRMDRLGPRDLYPFDPRLGQQSLEENLALFDRWHGAEGGRFTVLLGPQGPDFLSRDLLLRVKELARERGTRLHLHAAQGDRETIQIEGRYGMRPIPFLDSIGFLDEMLLAVHLTDATEEEAALVARRGASMILCSGSIGIIDGIVPPARAFREAGGQVALGSDQAPGNNCHNIFNEMKLTALFNKIRARDPEVFPAWEVLRMATIDGARAIGLSDEIGSLEPGKRADLITVDLRHPTLSPVYTAPMRNIVPNLVYSARGHEVDTVVIDGQVIMHERQLLTVDEAAIREEAQSHAGTLSRAATDAFHATNSPNLHWQQQGKL